MKKSILTPMAIILTLSVMAQTPKKLKALDINGSMTTSIAYGGEGTRAIQVSTPLKSFYMWTGIYPNITLSVSSPDSTKTITVTFSKSQVHFINDSTFTFKQQ